MHGIIVFLAVVGLIALVAIGFYIYLKRKHIADEAKAAAEQVVALKKDLNRL